MSKNIFLFLFLLLLLIPLPVLASSISSVSISSPNTITTDSEFALTINVNVAGIDKNDPNSQGIALVVYELVFNPNDFIITNVVGEAWDTKYQFDSANATFVGTSVINGKTNSNTCADGILYCGNYSVTVHLKTMTKESKVVTFTIKDVAVGLFDMLDSNIDYTEEELIKKANLITTTANESQVISIKNNNTNNNSQQNSVSTPSNKDDSNKGVDNNQNSSTNTTKSNNKNLKSIEIEGYTLDFKTEKKFYDLEIAKDVNSLNIKVVPEDSRATYKIIGNDDLKANDYRVSIEVTSEAGNQSIYVIKAKVKSDTLTKEDQNKKSFNFQISKKFLLMIALICAFLIGIFIIIKIIIHKKDRRLEKDLDQL